MELCNRKLLLALVLGLAAPVSAAAGPTFYRDIVPILQSHCQVCHRAGEIGPMPLGTYAQVRPWAKAIRDAVVTRKMPPWFASPAHGKFANDPSLQPSEIAAIDAWVRSASPPGNPRDSPTPVVWPSGWSIGQPDRVFRMPEPIHIPASRELDYQYVIIPTGLQADQWIRKIEIRPGDRRVVHHAVVYIREPDALWLRDRPMGSAFTVASGSKDSITTSDILFTYTPGNTSGAWPDGMAKLIPAGSDLVFQLHYTPLAQETRDQTSIGLVYAGQPPVERVLTLQLNGFRLFIPPNDPDYRVTVRGSLPNEAKLLSMYPHMHLRGKAFEYAIYTPAGRRTLLLVDHYDFYWQLTYRLAEPLLLAAGTRLECIATYDNSRNNPRNPDPGVMVRYGEQSTDEMMVGFFDIAVPASMDKNRFFDRHRQGTN